MKPLLLKNRKRKPDKFKEKIKNFFKVDLDEITKEEPSSHFEKIPLIRLGRNKIFLILTLFLILINILIGLDINFLYLRQILGFLFLILVPGLLLMLCFKIRTAKFWEFLVYTVGLSITFIMFAGLAVNWTLPALGITDKPLSLGPVVVCFNLFLILLGVVAYKRNKDFAPFLFTVPKLDTLNSIFFIIPIAFPVLAILGAFLLNNHGSNILTMIMLGSIAMYVLLLTIFRKKLNPNIWPWALYFIGLSLILTGSMRGWFISAPDAGLEYGISKIVFSQGHWDFWFLQGNYNAMLSVTILPVVLSLFSFTPLILITKLFYPFIFSIFFICLWKISRKILPKIFAFLATLFFLFQPTIFNWVRFPPRQEIAFIFLGAILLIFLGDKIGNSSKIILLFFFGISLAVSHYSTMVIFLLSLISIYLFQLFFKKFDTKIILKKVPFLLVLLLIIFSFLWYFQLTNTSNSFLDFSKKSISNLANLFKEEVYSQGNSPLEQISLFTSKKYNPSLDLLDYTSSIKNSSLDLKKIDFQYPSEISSGSIKPIYSSSFFLVFFQVMRNIFILLSKFLLILGVILYFIFSKYSYSKNSIFYLFGLVLFLLFCLLVLLPLASISYNLDRLYCQILIILSPISILGLIYLFKNKKYLIFIYVLFLMFFLLNATWFFFSFIGGSNLSMALENVGNEYDILHVSSYEINSASWLTNMPIKKEIVLDSYATIRIDQEGMDYNKNNLKTEVLPMVINKEDYVYSSNSNTIKKITFKYYGRGLLVYNFPAKFLSENKNKLYANGGSEIFK